MDEAQCAILSDIADRLESIEQGLFNLNQLFFGMLVCVLGVFVLSVAWRILKDYADIP